MGKTVIVMPAYNAELTLEQTINDIPQDLRKSIILVDDCSKDNTVALAKKLGLTVIQHEKNKGYGGNQKTCYKAALEAGADVIVMLHPDYQYNPKVVGYMAGVIENGICDIMLGNRIRTRKETLSGGMPLYKYISNRFLSLVCNIVTGENLGEWHSGLRAYSARVLKTLPWSSYSDDFIFDMQFLVQSAFCGLRMGDMPVETKYFSEASSINFKRSLKYGLLTLLTLIHFLMKKCGIKTSMLP